MKKISHVLLATLSLSVTSYAADFVVPSGTIVTTTQTLTDDGDVGLIEKGGAIEVTGGSIVGASMETSNQTIINQGVILATGDNNAGIFNLLASDNNMVTNSDSGVISVMGNNGIGIGSDGTNAMITNNGVVLSAGGGVSNGMFSSGVNSVITNNGVVSALGDLIIGILNEGGSSVITNNGVVSAMGDFIIGISNEGGSSMITNSGVVLATGNNGFGISNEGVNSVITNSGVVSATGNDGFGISNEGVNSVITNSGVVSVTGNDGLGISNEGVNSVITNSGKILVVGDRSDGIFNDGSSSAITNSGIVLATGNDGVGVLDESDSSVIRNSGVISATGEGSSIGIRISFNNENIHIINSGTIISEQSFALFINGLNPTLSLLRGSNLQGFVSTNPLNLNVETGLNLALTLTPDSDGFGSLGIEAPFVQIGNTIGVIDPTGLTLQADVLADLSDTILDGIYRHRTGCCTPYDCGLWTQGIGSYRKRGQDRGHVGYDNWQGGFLIGCDAALCKGYVGIFGGATFGKAEVDAYTQTADINTYVGGFSYEGCFCDTFVGGALVLGYVDWDNDRFVMNNLAPGGVQTAQASLNGLLISPEITLARPLDCIFCHPLMSFTFRYAGLFLGDYNEKGSLTNFSVNDREIDLLTTRLEVTFPFSRSCGNRCWSVEPYLGLFERFQVGGNHIDGELLDESLRFIQKGSRNLAAFLFGFRGIQSIGCLDLFLNIEASFDNEKSSRLLGEGGLAWNF